jgi:hypothetical protein
MRLGWRWQNLYFWRLMPDSGANSNLNVREIPLEERWDNLSKTAQFYAETLKER